MKTSRIFQFMLGVVLGLSCVLQEGCAYHFGTQKRGLPGGYKYVSIPVFKNKSAEPGVEVSFTNALIQEFERAKTVKITGESLSDVKIVGEIESIQYATGGAIDQQTSNTYLPLGTVLTTSYQILVKAHVSIIRQADNTQIWTGVFNGERSYNAPQVTIAGVNSVNPLYNLSARRQNIESVAGDMMAEAYDRITENF